MRFRKVIFGYYNRKFFLVCTKFMTSRASFACVTQGKLKQVNEQIHYTGQYLANKSVYRQFVNSRNKKKFRQEHQAELTLYETARKFLKGQSEDGKLPSMKLLKEEKEKLAALKKSQQEAYHNLRDYEKELNTVRKNIETFLGCNRSRQETQEKETARS